MRIKLMLFWYNVLEIQIEKDNVLYYQHKCYARCICR